MNKSIEQILNQIPDNQPLRIDSLHAQLVDLYTLVKRLGWLNAADFLSGQINLTKSHKYEIKNFDAQSDEVV